MKKIICLLFMLVIVSCSTTNIIVVADKEFMDEVKNDYNSLFIEQAAKSIKMMQIPQSSSCPLNRDLYFDDKFIPEY